MPHPRMPHLSRIPFHRPFLAALTCALAACGRDAGRGALHAALAARPGLAPRFSLVDAFRPCTERTPPAGGIAVASCPARPGERADAAPLLRAADGDPAAQHGLALVDLFSNDPQGRKLDRSVTSLRRSAELSGDSVAALADLAGALIVRAERGQATRDLLEAYEMAERAVSREPRDPEALYNRALALDRLGLVDETAAAWTEYLHADWTSAWADEARRRLQRVRTLAAAVREPGDDAQPEALATYAVLDPQWAREQGMDRLLAEWGEAVDAGDTARANDRLRRAAVLGDALRRRPGGDRSLADAVDAIRRAKPRARAALARAHRDYGTAMRRYDAAEFEASGPLLDGVVRDAKASPALRGWAGVYLATVDAHLHRRDVALAGLRRALADVDQGRYPAMAARVLWSYGNTLSRAEKWEHGLDSALVSARLFAAAGEAENQGAALGVAADARFVLGEPDSGYATVHRALAVLRPYRASLRRHNLLATAADQAAEDGLPRAAVRLSDEDVRVAGRMAPKYLAEALVRRARHRAEAGQLAAARADVARARPMLAVFVSDSSLFAKWVRAEFDLTEAITLLGHNPSRKAAAIDSSAAFFTGIALPFRLLPVLVAGAGAQLEAGDEAGASRRLERVMRLLEHRRDSIHVEPRRAAVFDAARAAVDRLVMLKLRQGQAEAALRYVDRARASLAPAGSRPRARRDGPLARPGEVAVEYALIGDTLLAWTVAGERVEVVRIPVDTARLVRTLDQLEARLEADVGEAEVRPALSLLYEWLVRPVAGRLGAAETPVVLVADGSLAAVPFAALLDARRGRYLVDDHPLRFAVSLAEAARPPPRTAAGGALFVADPAFDPRENRLLDRLPRAGEEARGAATRYPGATLLDGTRATRAALEAALPGAAVAHFGGHAVFDDARPERSYLVLAPAPGDPAGRLTAAELAGLDLHRVRLVVLSACRTTRTGHSRAAGYSGLSGALLAAGAAGTVGSTWNVEEGATARLMTEFHRAYATRPDGPGALRQAQRAMAHGSDSRLRSPAAWAGFRYAGD